MAKGCALLNPEQCKCKVFAQRGNKVPTVSGVANEYTKQAHCPYYVELSDGRSDDGVGEDTASIPAKSRKPRGRPRAVRLDDILPVE